MSISHSHQDYSCQIADFQDRPVWVAWRNEFRKNKSSGEIKATKVPYRSKDRKAESNDPSTWITLDEADRVAEAIGGGIGLILGVKAHDDIHIGGIDLDTCRTGDATERWATEIIERFASYTEISPSGSGAKVFFLYRCADLERLQTEIFHQRKYGTKVAAKTGEEHPPAIELYLKGRYFAVTGESDGYPQELRLVSFDDLNWLVSDAMGRFADANAAVDTVVPEPSCTGTRDSAGNGVLSNSAGAFGSEASGEPKGPRDASRSGIAWNKVLEWRRWGQCLNYRQMLELLANDPDTCDWYDEYRDEPNERQFRRLWKRSEPAPESIDDRFAEIARVVAEEKAMREAEDIAANEETGEFEQAHWPEPLDIFGNLTPEPKITRDMLPEKIADFVYEQSDLLGCDPGAMAVAAIALCASLISDSITLMPKRYDSTYLERARLWVILVGSVSSKKTPMLIKINRVVKKTEERMRREDAFAMEGYKNQLAQYELKKKTWDKRMADDDEEVSGWPPQKPEKPPRRRLITNDFTVEALAPILCDNPRGLLIELDEIVQLFGGMDAYKASGVKRDRAAILQLWNGGFRAVDRVRTQDEPVCVPNWGAGIIGGIQYDKLDQIGPKLVDDGLLQRFVIVPMKQIEEVDRPPDLDIIRNYDRLIESLIAFNPIEPAPIRLSDTAHEYRDRIEALIRAFESFPGLSEGFRGHAGKMGAIFARLLLTLHVIECSPVYEAERLAVVSGDAARRAYELMTRFMIPNAMRQYERMYQGGGDQLTEDARWLAGHILARALDKVNQRVCHDASRRFKKDSKRAERAMQALREANWLTDDGSVNPRVHQAFAERAASERKSRDDKMARIKTAQTVVRQTYEQPRVGTGGDRETLTTARKTSQKSVPCEPVGTLGLARVG